MHEALSGCTTVTEDLSRKIIIRVVVPTTTTYCIIVWRTHADNNTIILNIWIVTSLWTLVINFICDDAYVSRLLNVKNIAFVFAQDYEIPSNERSIRFGDEGADRIPSTKAC